MKIIAILLTHVLFLHSILAYNVGLCIVATGRYDKFAEQLIASARNYFCTNHNVTYFVFTDSEKLIAPDIVKIYQQKLGWPYDTLMRFAMYDLHMPHYDLDYIFALDADMLLVAPVGDEIFHDRVATQHPGYVDRRGTYEINSISTAYVNDSEGNIYFAGGFYGGTKKEFLMLVHLLKNNIEIDLQKNHIAIWHDESHLNRYFIDFEPTVILSSSYCYPEDPCYNLTCSKKIIARSKNHIQIRKKLRRQPKNHDLQQNSIINVPSKLKNMKPSRK